MIENDQRKRATWQGAACVLLAPFCLAAVGRSQETLAHLPPLLQRAASLVLVFLGLALSIAGLWRLSVARDRRWDLRGILVLCLMLVVGIPTLGLLLFLIVSGIMGPIFGGR